MDEYDRLIVNALQDGLPLCEQPFAALARELDTDEQTIVTRIAKLLDEGILSRFGPLYNAEGLGAVIQGLEVLDFQEMAAFRHDQVQPQQREL